MARPWQSVKNRSGNLQRELQIMKWFNNAPIGLKIFLSVAAIMVIAFGTIGSLSYARVSALLQHDIQTSYRNTANNSANLVASQIDKLKATVEAIAERPDIRSMNFAVQQPALLREAQRIGCLRFSIVDLQGNLLTTDRKKGANIADKPYFLRAKQGETAVGGPSLAKVDGKLILVVTTPIRDAGNRVAAVLNAVFDGKILTDILRQIRVADGKGSVYMVDREGTLIANPQHYELVLKQDNSLKNAARDPRLGAMAGYTRKMIAGGTGFGSYFFNGITKFIAYNPVPGMDWFLAVTVPRDHIFKPIDDLTWQFPAMFLIALGFILAVIYVVTRSYVSRPIAGLMAAAEKLALGNVNVDLRAGSGDEIGRLIQAFNKMIANIREGAQAARGIAAGDLAVTIRPKSDDDLQALSMQQMIDSLRELIDETQRLTGAAAAGELAVRGDNAKFQGAFGEIVLGINRMLDAMVGPLNTAADYVERIGQGEIPPPLTEEYQGEYNQLKISINACIKGLGALTESNAVLQQMALNDYTRQIAGDYHGVYGEIAQAVNKVLAKLIGVQQTAAHMAQGDFGDLEALQKVGRLSEHDELTPSLARMMGTILAMVHESVRLSEAAAAGELNVRGDIGKFGGEYRRVIEGFNATLDAVVGPLTEAGAVLAKIAVNDYTQEMKGEYQGVLREFAAQINTTRARLLSVQDVFVRLAQGDISRLEEFRAVGRRSENDRMMPSATAMMEAIDALIQESNMLAGAAAGGELKVRGDAAKFSGKYQEIVIGLNGALDAMALPITEASAVLDEMARGSLESVMAGNTKGNTPGSRSP
jgi:methyl-accepting chemotaxis protein